MSFVSFLLPMLIFPDPDTHTLHTGQAGAIRLGISRALLAFPGNHGNTLEKAGLLVRDPRMVERKKPGQKKARKKFAW